MVIVFTHLAPSPSFRLLPTSAGKEGQLGPLHLQFHTQSHTFKSTIAYYEGKPETRRRLQTSYTSKDKT